MTELSGMLDGLGLSAIVRFLSGLQKSGCLRLAQDDWSGEIFFDQGRLSHATLGTRTGLTALDAIIELFPTASFAFDSNAAEPSQSTIDLDHESLLAHLDEIGARVARGERQLPTADVVPAQAASDGAAEEPVQVDRASLQTLMLVDGQRSVREIVARRTFDALWQLVRLREAGLIQLGSTLRTAPSPESVAPALPSSDPNPPAPSAPPGAEVASASTTPALAEPAVAAAPVMTAPVAPLTPVVAPPEEPVGLPSAHCPKLGFEDDPGSSFGRPTRLHRCFAAGKPLPLSLDQQRELCLSEQYPTCPRLLAAHNPTPRPVSARPEASPREPRIVRLPLLGRPPSTERDVPSSAAPAPIPLRDVGAPGKDDGAAGSPTMVGPTPLRARMGRGSGAAAGAASTASASPPERDPMLQARLRPEPARMPDAAESPHMSVGVPLRERSIGPIPLRLIPALGLVLVAVGVIVYLLLPQSDSLFGDNSLDPSTLPNASLVAAGTPVADLAINRATPVAVDATPAPAQAGQAAATDASAPQTAAAPVVSKPSAARPQATAAPVQQPTSVTNVSLFDERFSGNDAGWPSSPTGAAQITNGTYRIVTRQAGQFAAVSAPVASIPSDVVISASFRKLAGPPGGGYGIIVRDQSDATRDGSSQDGRYYVLEAGDKGEVGIWRRDGDHWVDLLPWQHSDAVKTDTGTNELVVKAIGNTLSLSVNGAAVASRTDNALASGRVGLFVGGDGNQVAVSRFTIQTP
jgi:uncharacterized protein DUF4388